MLTLLDFLLEKFFLPYSLFFKPYLNYFNFIKNDFYGRKLFMLIYKFLPTGVPISVFSLSLKIYSLLSCGDSLWNID